MITNLATLFGFGLLLGLQHAFDADHIAAVSTLLIRTKSIKRSAWLGVAWGLGHTLMLCVAGSFIIFFKLSIPAMVADLLERIVGVVLVILGIQALYRMRSGITHAHEHSHGKWHHTHTHTHSRGQDHACAHHSFFLGLLHGMAGSSAIALFVLSTVRSTSISIAFLLIFGLGSIIGMALTSAGIGLPLTYSSKYPFVGRMLHVMSGTASTIIGLWIIMWSV